MTTTKIQSPEWLTNEVMEYLIHPETLHTNELFCFEMERWDTSLFVSLEALGKTPIEARFCIDDRIKWVNIRTMDSLETYEALCIQRYDKHFVHVFLASENTTLKFNMDDILWVRDTFSGQRVILTDKRDSLPYVAWRDYFSLNV